MKEGKDGKEERKWEEKGWEEGGGEEGRGTGKGEERGRGEGIVIW